MIEDDGHVVNEKALFSDLDYQTFINERKWNEYRRRVCVCRLDGRTVGSLRREFPRLHHITEREFTEKLLPWMTGGCGVQGHKVRSVAAGIKLYVGRPRE